MIPTDHTIDTNSIFSGGAGMFIQYNDIIKPLGLYVIVKMMLMDESYGLPLEILKEMTNVSLVEWYVNRRYKNPLRCLDFLHKLDPNEIDQLYQNILTNDPSIFKLATPLNVVKMLSVYRMQHMNFPVYIYHPFESQAIKDDCSQLFNGVNIAYAFGDLDHILKRDKQNFTYIFSDIELVKQAAEMLIGTCSHVMLAQDYRYNHGKLNKFRYDLIDLAKKHPFVRMGLTGAVNKRDLAFSLGKLYK